MQRPLTRIADDELRHAELAWRFVKWALAELGPDVRRAVRDEVQRIRIELSTPAAPQVSSRPGVAEHGILSDLSRNQIRRSAIEEIVLPCAAALIESSETDGAPTAARADLRPNLSIV